VENITKLTKRYQNSLLLLLYLILFSIIISPAIQGLGMFWDWDWPVFSEQLKSFYTNYDHAWVDNGFGQPMTYNSGFYLRVILSGGAYLGLNPEVILYLLLVILISATAYGGFLFARKKMNPLFSFLIGSAVVLNPAYLYKLVSGHLFYLFSFAIFVYFIYYLHNQYKKDFKTTLVLGLLFGFVGAQIQFFAFAAILLVIYYLFTYKKFKFRNLALISIIAFLINLPWLSNFLTGAIQFSNVSGQAGEIAFSGASLTSILRIATLSFADATLIKFFYPKYLLIFFGLFSLGLSGLILWRVKKRNIPAHIWYLLLTLIVMVALGTGFFHSWNIPYFSRIYPMFRESGHFAPIIVLLMILLLVRLWPNEKIILSVMSIYLVLFVSINAIIINTSLPTLNYKALRDHLEPYKEFLDKDKDIYRIATYPFFGQYSVAWENDKEVRGQPVGNTGIDTFSQNSKYDTLSNYISAQKIKQSVQFRFLKGRDLQILEERNIKYILDLSNIYQSNIERYSDPSFYENDLGLIKNDSFLFKNLINEYPERITQVAPNIYKLTKYDPRIEAKIHEAKVVKVNSSKYLVKIENFSSSDKLYFRSNFHDGWKLFYNKGNKSFLVKGHEREKFGQSWNLDLEYINRDSQQNSDESPEDLELELLFAPEKYFLIAKYISLATIVLLSLGIVRRPRK